MNKKNILLESPVYTLEAAMLAAENGADRLELCSDFGEGGTTPSLGLFKVIKRKVTVPVVVMIRPRGGDFVYSKSEIEVMKEDIKAFLEHGADGFVFGILDKQGKINSSECQNLIQVAGGKPCTFHRAFDLVQDKVTALEEIVALGFKRILTSGGENRVKEGLPVLLELLDKANDRIIILPGGGLMLNDISHLSKEGRLKEIHVSCKKFRPSSMKNANGHLKLSQVEETEGMVLTVDTELMKEVVGFLRKL
ncbi:copper homeostasis protein CutC [uncultured Cyclobacterium sp.]|uniref:copper homeostasis protein CutC n=1 Tax=uncultured Cyclobacterium sp. TaxID=453820 RepID=UPI0030EE23BE